MKGSAEEAIGWKMLLILLIVFLVLLFLFQMGIVQKIVDSIKPVIRIIEWGQ